MTRGRTKYILSDVNFYKYYKKSDQTDRIEGTLAYAKYHVLLNKIANTYCYEFKPVVAAFCALSPNNDYYGNLRSLVSVLDGLNRSTPHKDIIVSTYNHCKYRAIMYLNGEKFETSKRGMKILNFYRNLIDPTDSEFVTIDGHMAAMFIGDDKAVMKEMIIGTRKEYKRIAKILSDMANELGLLPNQLQATLWFTRKRILKIKYVPNRDMFADKDDSWRINVCLESLKPYESK